MKPSRLKTGHPWVPQVRRPIPSTLVLPNPSPAEGEEDGGTVGGGKLFQRRVWREAKVGWGVPELPPQHGPSPGYYTLTASFRHPPSVIDAHRVFPPLPRLLAPSYGLPGLPPQVPPGLPRPPPLTDAGRMGSLGPRLTAGWSCSSTPHAGFPAPPRALGPAAAAAARAQAAAAAAVEPPPSPEPPPPPPPD